VLPATYPVCKTVRHQGGIQMSADANIKTIMGVYEAYYRGTEDTAQTAAVLQG